jgi:hypothetical protein
MERPMQTTSTRQDVRRRPRDTDALRLLRTLHAHARDRGIDHELLSANACVAYGVRSLTELSDQQLRDYIQQLCQTPATVRPATTVGPASGRSPKRVAPTGKRRPDGVVWLPTAKQRAFIARLLGERFDGYPDPVGAAVRHVRACIGSDLPADVGIHDMESIADAIETGKAASQLINRLIGDLRRSGQWGHHASPERERGERRN